MSDSGLMLRGDTPVARDAISAAVNATDHTPASAIYPVYEAAKLLFLAPIFVLLNDDAFGSLVAVFVAGFPPFMYAVLEVVEVKTDAACPHVLFEIPTIVLALATVPPAVELLARTAPVLKATNEIALLNVLVVSAIMVPDAPVGLYTHPAKVTGKAVRTAPAYPR